MLKRWMVFGGAVIAILVGAMIWQGYSKNTLSRDHSSGQALGIEILMRNVDQHRTGPVIVEGVVSVTDAANRTLALIDIAEFQECGVTNCAALTLPIRWSGPMPQLQSFVRVKGDVQEQDNRLVFVAQTLEKMEPASGASQ